MDRKLTVKGKEKYIPRYLIWQALGVNGHRLKSYIYFNKTVTAKIYLDKCVKARLLSFIRQHYPAEQILFWPDLARSHYQKDVLSFLRESGIEVVMQRKTQPSTSETAMGLSLKLNIRQVRNHLRTWLLHSIGRMPMTLPKCPMALYSAS